MGDPVVTAKDLSPQTEYRIEPGAYGVLDVRGNQVSKGFGAELAINGDLLDTTSRLGVAFGAQRTSGPRPLKGSDYTDHYEVGESFIYGKFSLEMVPGYRLKSDGTWTKSPVAIGLAAKAGPTIQQVTLPNTEGPSEVNGFRVDVKLVGQVGNPTDGFFMYCGLGGTADGTSAGFSAECGASIVFDNPF